MGKIVRDRHVRVIQRRTDLDSFSENLNPPVPIEIHVGHVLDVQDQTVYVRLEEIDTWLNQEAKPRLVGTFLKQGVIEEEITLKDDACKCRGRALICLCAKKEWVSITLRRKGDLTGLGGKQINKKIRHAREIKRAEPAPTEFAEETFKRDDAEWFLNPVGDLYSLLYDNILMDRKTPQGLIVVAGSTGTGKSKVARGLIDRYLRELIEKHPAAETIRRRPHLVTFEDPIETFLFSDTKDESGKSVTWHERAAQGCFDYTPRQRGYDVKSLTDAFLHAKRQTPAIFYIGEVREEREWKEIITFAGDGNLVVATTHSNSVVECMKKLFKAADVRTPVDRGQIAGRLLGIIHLRPYKLKVERILNSKSVIDTFARQVTLPSLWRQTQRGVSALVSDGLASILPFNPSGKDSLPSSIPSSIGRRWFALQLLEKAKNHHAQLQDETIFETVTDDLIQISIEWDLEEM